MGDFLKKKILRDAIISVLFAFLLLYNSSVGINGVKSGLDICFTKIIPSLFPFTVLALFIGKSNLLLLFKKFEKFTIKVFSLNSLYFMIYFISLISGFPIGSKLINSMYSEGKMSKEDAKILVCFCVNGGPAFIIISLSNQINKNIAIIIFISHLLSSIILMKIYSRFLENKNSMAFKVDNISFSDNFVSSVSGACETLITISAFIVAFSVLISYYDYYFKGFKNLKFLFEISYTVSNFNNPYLLSFAFGFGGLCVWLQIISVTKDIKISLIPFAVSRVLHGTLSVIITYLTVKIFKIDLETISNNINFSLKGTYNGIFLSISMLFMVILLIIEVKNKKIGRKIFKNNV